MKKDTEKVTINSIHNNVKIIEDLGVNKSKHHYYACECQKCGSKFRLLQNVIIKNKTACPICKKSKYIGKIIDGYEVVKRTDRSTSDRHVIYICKCIHCSRQKEVSSRNFAKGKIKKCGCNGFNLNQDFLKQILF